MHRSAERWQVVLRNGDGKEFKPSNLEPVSGGFGRVYVVWGNARWTRTQLLGEVARGHWGLGRASINEVAMPAEKRWNGLDGRLVFAPETEMTEDFMRRARHEMDAYKAQGMVPNQAGQEEVEEEEEEEEELLAEPGS